MRLIIISIVTGLLRIQLENSCELFLLAIKCWFLHGKISGVLIFVFCFVFFFKYFFYIYFY